MTKTATIAPEVLADLLPLRELMPEALEALAEEAEIEDFPARSVLFRKGSSDPWTRYLLSGTLLLAERADGEHTLLGVGDLAAAADPLGFVQPHEQTAIARTDVRVIRLQTARIKALLQESRLPEYEVAEVDGQQEEVGVQLFYRLFQDLQDDRLELPSMPDIAVRVREAVSHDDVSPPDVARIIQNDPVVAARIIQAANSAIYSAQQPTDSLTGAIVRLGLKTTREIVTAITLREVFKTKNPLLNKRMVELWMHSTLVAAIASVLARKLPGFSSERALLAGLVHEIGVVPMLAHAHQYPELAADPAMLEATIREYRGQVGAMILRRWNFPEDLIAVPVEAGRWQREHTGEADYADLIMVAKLQSYVGTAAGSRFPALSSLSAYERLGLATIGISDTSPLIDEAREDIAEVQRVLLG